MKDINTVSLNIEQLSYKHYKQYWSVFGRLFSFSQRPLKATVYVCGFDVLKGL